MAQHKTLITLLGGGRRQAICYDCDWTTEPLDGGPKNLKVLSTSMLEHQGDTSH